MMNDYPTPKNCERFEELVSYLYNEIDGSRRTNFETHLVNCAACAEEIAEFSLVRETLTDWRTSDFEPLATPIIELPVIAGEFSAQNTAPLSLFEQLRSWLIISPAWAGTAALLLIGGGFLWFSLSSAEQPIARVEPSNITAPATVSPVEEIAETANNQTPNKEINTQIESSVAPTGDSAKARETKKALSRAVSTAIEDRRPAIAQASVKIDKPIIKKSRQSPPPTLLADENDYEDNALRLADVFKDIGGRELR